METLLWTFETSNTTLNVIGSNLYEAVWSLSNWFGDEIQEVKQIKITNVKDGSFKIINKTLQPEILVSVNKSLKISKTTVQKKVGLINYGGMSCYMDSVLVPILLLDSKLQEQLLTNKSEQDCENTVQEKLIELKKLIESKEKQKTCSLFFNSLKSCESFKKLTEGGQQDDHEFFNILLQLFKIEPTTVKEQLYVYDNNETWKLKNDRTLKYGIIEINIFDYPENTSILEFYQRGVFSNYYDTVPKEKPKGIDDKTPVDYTYVYNRIMSSEFLIFHTGRLIPGVKLNTEVKIPNTIKNLETKKEYELSIITVHRGGAKGGHYVSYFKIGLQWYFYDDLSPGINPINIENEMKTISKNSSLIFYF